MYMATLIGSSVNDFAQVFLLTYRKFLTPFKLLQLIIKFYNFYITRKDADAGGSSKVPRDRLLFGSLMWAADVNTRFHQVKRLRMCNFLKTWMERFANDFDSRMIEAYRFFVEQSVAQHEGERLAKQLSSLIDRERPKSLYRGVFVAATSPPTPIMPRNAENFGFLDLDPMEIARQLTLIEYENYSKIQVTRSFVSSESQFASFSPSSYPLLKCAVLRVSQYGVDEARQGNHRPEHYPHDISLQSGQHVDRHADRL
jgi:hypothetical protein